MLGDLLLPIITSTNPILYPVCRSSYIEAPYLNIGSRNIVIEKKSFEDDESCGRDAVVNNEKLKALVLTNSHTSIEELCAELGGMF